MLNLEEVVAHFLALLTETLDHSNHSLIDPALEIHRVCACGNVLQTDIHNRLCQHCSRGRAVARIVVGLRSHLFYELCTYVFERIFQLDFLCYRDTVFGDLWRTELAFHHHVAPLRT